MRTNALLRLRPSMHMRMRMPIPAAHNAATRALTTTTPARSSSPFTSGPSPPRLPKEEQERFEQLQRQSTGAFSTPQSSSPASSSSPAPSKFQINQSPDSAAEDAAVKEIPRGEEVHPNMRRGAPPEFEGEVNPKTGEVGGPKNEPLRWGAGGDWSFNGRVTDF